MDPVAEIKARLDVADIIGEYLTMKPAGTGSFKALCPFHNEKTPSFYINRPRQSWHCFGCDKGGDLISFVQEIEGMDFPDTLAHLAQKAGVELPQYDPKASSEKKRLYEVNELASKFFRAFLLTSPSAETARAYVAKRGIDELTGDLWRIGYAPDSWNSLIDALIQKNVTEDEMLKAGLIQKNESGRVYDRFRNRIMFTIWDVHGNVIGFTGRILTDSKEEAKYVNTPETNVYKKSQVLYGLDKGKGDIKRENLAVIVEGNMDVVSSHQFGIANVVASSGTALTADQLNLIKRFTKNLAIAFDGDAAGKAATLRGLDLARQQDFNIRVISLPSEAGKDPDDAVRKDPELWRRAIKDAAPVIDWVYRNAFKGKDPSKPEGKKQIAAELVPELRRISNSVERDAWLKRLADDLGVSEESVRDLVKSAAPSTKFSPYYKGELEGVPEAKTQQKQAKTQEEDLDERLLALLYLKPELEALAQELLQEYYLPRSPDEDLLNFLAVYADREFQDQSLDALRRELEVVCTQYRKLRISKTRADLEREMRDAERIGDSAKIQELLTQFNQLM
jgi:DNA primase